MDEGEVGDNPIEVYKAKFDRALQIWLDRSVVYHKSRWGGFFGLLSLYLLRVYLLEGWYIVTYGLGIFLLNNVIGFLSPQIDPENEGPVLPSKGSDEFRPFSRRLPEFQFWYHSFRGVAIAMCMTFFNFFNIPVFWPILLLYFLVLFFLTMKRQIKHMMKHNYVPWSIGKAKYAKGGGS
jgi:hypothetical protein